MNATAESIPAQDLSLVSALVKELRAKAQLIGAKEQELKALQAEHDAIEQVRLPDALAELGFTRITLADGAQLEVKREYHCGIAEPRREAAHEWLRENGLGDVIKTTLALTFGKGEEEAARATFEELSAQLPDTPIKLAPAVHPQTLKALVRERDEAGQPMPEELFGVFIINRARITAPK